jgi:quinol monooxygenase YgiN
MAAEPITVVVTFQIKEGERERFRRALLDHLPNCVGELTCRRLWVYEDPADPARFMLYEDWDDMTEFLEVQLQRPYREPYMAATEHLWARPRETSIWRRLSTEWEPLGAAGDPISLTTDCNPEERTE